MPSPAAVGGWALAAGAVGVGTAYAAGAFAATYKNFDDYANKNGFIYIGIVGDSDNNSVKKLLDEDKGTNKNGYRDLLKGVWNSMDDSGITTPTKPKITNDNDLSQLFPTTDTISKSSEIAAFTKAWCEIKKLKKLAEDKTWTEKTIKEDSEWGVFKSACLREKQA
ncbi:hypothetical protein [Candidatus Mycoplasma haematohominis]|uniref:Uncharacterized protein n=1 Tax=Candidatus Mycoplasma haematohominis TaxID=1494318 RepID=A0A478FUW4_9MOLU|nr:hypothetical protein [Candidatus Mycoplasma haemohominis]GCE63915.1 hypothetical protein MHSWG343_09220 [Candidatus Mycoplasma haemohominis]